MPDFEINIPLTQLMTVFSLVCLCILLGRHKLGLVTGILACLYWGLLANFQSLILNLNGNASGALVFLGCVFILSFGGLYILLQPDR